MWAPESKKTRMFRRLRQVAAPVGRQTRFNGCLVEFTRCRRRREVAVYACWFSCAFHHFLPGTCAMYCNQRICLSLSLSLCLFKNLKNHMSKFHKIFCSWMLPMAAARSSSVDSAIHYGFVDDAMFTHNEVVDQNQRQYSLVVFATWRNRGHSWCLWLQACAKMRKVRFLAFLGVLNLVIHVAIFS